MSFMPCMFIVNELRNCTDTLCFEEEKIGDEELSTSVVESTADAL